MIRYLNDNLYGNVYHADLRKDPHRKDNHP